MYYRQQLLQEAFKSYNQYMNFEHKAKFMFIHREVLTNYEVRQNKNGDSIKSVLESWLVDCGVCEEVVVIGAFRGTMIDNIVSGIERSLDSFGNFYDETEVYPDCLMKSTKIDCVRVDKTPPFPSTLTDQELEDTWCSLTWRPNS